MSILEYGWFLGTPTSCDWINDTPEYFGINPHHQTRDFMVPEKVVSDLEKKIRVQGKMTRQISLMSWTMRGYYTLEPLAYGFHKICVWLVYLIESPLYKYLVKYRYHVTSLINIGPGSCGHFMEPQAVQQYIHTPRMQKRVCQANFLCICLLYRLCRHQEQNH